jgi:hypothetical protein
VGLLGGGGGRGLVVGRRGGGAETAKAVDFWVGWQLLGGVVAASFACEDFALEVILKVVLVFAFEVGLLLTEVNDEVPAVFLRGALADFCEVVEVCPSARVLLFGFNQFGGFIELLRGFVDVEGGGCEAERLFQFVKVPHEGPRGNPGFFGLALDVAVLRVGFLGGGIDEQFVDG